MSIVKSINYSGTPVANVVTNILNISGKGALKGLFCFGFYNGNTGRLTITADGVIIFNETISNINSYYSTLYITQVTGYPGAAILLNIPFNNTLTATITESSPNFTLFNIPIVLY